MFGSCVNLRKVESGKVESVYWRWLSTDSNKFEYLSVSSKIFLLCQPVDFQNAISETMPP